MADVPVGVFLSGGLDSSLIAAIAAKKQPNISTFSIGFSSADHDESPYARIVADAVGSRHHHFLFDEESFRTLLPKVVSALDEPVGDQALLPVYWLSQEARRHVTVALSGEGADEIFAGYSYYRPYVQENGWPAGLKAQSGQTAGLRRLVHNPEPSSPSGFPLLTDVSCRSKLTGRKPGEFDEWETNLLSWLDQTTDSLRRATATDLATWLPDDLLVKFDRMSMAHSLEGRAPYLDPKVVEAGMMLHQSQKVNGETTKVALRRIAGDWLPREILERPKKGFVLPMAKWLSQWFAAYPSIYDYFEARSVPGLNTAEVANLVTRDLLAGVRRERLLFALVLLVEWYQSFQERKYKLARQYRETTRNPSPMVIG